MQSHEELVLEEAEALIHGRTLPSSTMLNMAGNGDALTDLSQELVSKSAFMEIQQPGMGPGGMPHAPYQIRPSYSSHNPAPMDNMGFSSQPRSHLGYSFPSMPPHSTYNPPGHHFATMNPYQPPGPGVNSPPREGQYTAKRFYRVCCCTCCTKT